MRTAWVYARTIIEELDVSVSATAFRQQFARFDEAYDALKWVLARRADRLGLHRTVAGTEYRLYRQDRDPLAMTPALIVVYTCTPNEVTIISLRAER
jgi:hypothetical protein